MLRRLARLGPAERGLLFRAVLWIGVVRIGLGTLPFRRLERALDRLSARFPLSSPAAPERVAWAVAAAARRLPGTRCLAWSLACRGLLGQAGVPSTLRFGVARTAERRFQAHAWLECGGRTLSWGDDVSGYAPLGPLAGRDG